MGGAPVNRMLPAAARRASAVRRILAAVTVLAATMPGIARAQVERHVSADLGYRTGKFRWSIAGDEQNVLSELTWDRLQILRVDLGGDLVGDERWTFKGNVSFGSVLSARNRDSDYAGNDRTLEWSRSYADAGGSEVWDAAVGFGYRFSFFSTGLEPTFTVTPCGGYSYHRQLWRMTDGNLTISDSDLAPRPVPPVGPFPDLDSSYEATWQGPWVGVDLWWDAGGRSRVLGRLELHRADYDAVADWNLRSDFQHPVSFEHDADGRGVLVEAGWIVEISLRTKLRLGLEYQDWTTAAGTDTIYFFDGTVETGKLNEVVWRSQSITAGVTYRY